MELGLGLKPSLNPVTTGAVVRIDLPEMAMAEKTGEKAEIDLTRRAEKIDMIISLYFLHVNHGSDYNYKFQRGRNEIRRWVTSSLRDKRGSFWQFRTKQNIPRKWNFDSFGFAETRAHRKFS